ncbi:hypothetical protein Q5H93_03710 [Hymenobacter sp. ASUV-10]|uniref:Uncharacterized protein n=1 Tax=Hymenobacter aranciens TaxID=3063996 RepID=A0ABT9B6C4_9BACT|nr:hypothetical protein [Hymenobacter sp. ASUV-10]MDO7873826.1 hypothetical protein [Hymenobacter sp. ASUV-10]
MTTTATSRRLPLLLALLLPGAYQALAQTTPGVGIGTTVPDVSAALDIVSSDKGLLLPRVADATSIATPATGLLVFQTGGTPGFYYNAGTPAAPNWQQIATAAGAALTATNGLTKTGAAIGLGGTLTQATTIATAGFDLGLTGTGRLGVGTSSPATTLDVRTTDGSARITVGTTANTGGGIAFGNTGHGIQRGFPTLDADNNVGFYTTAGNLYLSGNSNRTDQFVLTNGGSVGIGTGTPTARQETVGDLRVTYAGSGAGTVGTATAVNVLGTGMANLGQSFTLNTATTITSVTLRASNTYATTLTLYTGAGNAGTALTAALPISFTAGSPATVTLPTPLAVGAGVYTLVLATGNGVSTHNGNVYNGGTVYVGTSAQPHLDLEFTVAFSAGPATALYAGAGSVGVNTGAPTATLDVNGSTRLRGLTTPGVVTTDAQGNLGSAAAPSGTDFIQNQTAADQTGGFRVSGTGTADRLAATSTVFVDAANANTGTFTGSSPLKGVVFGSAGSGEGIGANRAGGPNGFGVDIYTNFTPRLSVANSGNVGIGTSSPSQKLDVNGSANVTGNGYVGGQLGVGTTSPGGQLANTSVNTFGSYIHGGGGSSLNWAANQAGYVAQFYNGGTGAASHGVVVKIDGSDAGAFALDVSKGAQNTPGTSLLAVKATGRVGIGTTNPQGTLDVASGTVRLPGGGGNDTWFNYSDGKNYLRGTTVMGEGGSSVGIGTSSPTATLDVAGSTRLRGLATAGLVVTDANGNLSSSTSLPAGVTGDNLGNHTATQALNLQGNALTGSGSSIAGVGLGVRADGGLNIGQNTSDNIFLGYLAGAATTPGGGLTGTRNTLTGVRSGRDNTTGGANTFTGYESGRENETGSFNVFLGYQSGVVNTSGSNNAFTGNQSGFVNTSGSGNTFTGTQSGRGTTTGNNNTFVGLQAGRYNDTGSSNTALGAGSGPATGSDALTNTTAVGANAVVTASNSVVLGNNANVGIGTSAPTEKLEVAGGIKFTGAGSVLTFPDGSTQAIAATGTSFIQNQTSTNQAGGFRISGDALVGGNVGIGTPTPGARLDVNGSIWSRSTVRVDANDTNNGGLSTNAALYFGNGSSASFEGIASKRTSGGNQYGLDFYTANTNRLAISNTGAVSLGSLVGTGTRLVTADASGILSTTAAPSGTDFIQNQTTPQANSNFNVAGTGTVGGLLTATGGATVAGATNINTTGTAGTNIGTGATSGTVSIGRVGGDTFLYGPVTVAGNTNINTGTGAATTSIGTGTGSGAVSIGRSGGSTGISGSTTVTGTTAVNTSGTAATSIGNSTGALTLTGPTTVTGTVGITGATTITGPATVSGNVGIGTTAPAAKLEVVGDVRIPAANSYTYAAARPKSLMLGGFDFKAENGTVGTAIDGSTDEFYPTNGTTPAFRAPVHLPQGAVITSITLLGYDFVTPNLTADLITYTATSSANRTTLTTAASSGTPGYTSVNSATIATTVDNDNNTYSVRVSFGAVNTNGLTLRGVRVNYTINKVE